MNRPSLLEEKVFRTFNHSVLQNVLSAEAGGFEPPVREPVRQFSKLLVSATHPNFLGSLSVSESICSQMRVQRYEVFFSYAHFSRFFSELMLIFFDIYFFSFFFRHVRRSFRVLKSFLMMKPMPCVLSDERVKYLSFVWL